VSESALHVHLLQEQAKNRNTNCYKQKLGLQYNIRN